jgi:hypothetical protein
MALSKIVPVNAPSVAQKRAQMMPFTVVVDNSMELYTEEEEKCEIEDEGGIREYPKQTQLCCMLRQ